MAVHKAFPPDSASIPPKYLSPGFSTLIFGAVAVIWYVGLTILSPGVVLANSILALGFGISFYYGITGIACVIYYRRLLFKSVKNFIFIGLAPLLGGLMLGACSSSSVFYYSNPDNSATTGQAWFQFIHFSFHIPQLAHLREEGCVTHSRDRGRVVAHRAYR